jgi:hypothetical protein
VRVTTGTRFGLRHRWEWLRLGQLGRCLPARSPGLQLQQDSADRRPRLAGSTSLLHPGLRAMVKAVIRRGPSGCRTVGRWDLARSRSEPGAWIRGNLPSALRPVPGRAVVPLLHAPGRAT